MYKVCIFFFMLGVFGQVKFKIWKFFPKMGQLSIVGTNSVKQESRFNNIFNVNTCFKKLLGQ